MVIKSSHCDRLIHYCYAGIMWNEKDIIGNVRPALERSLEYGMPKQKIILALTARGLTDWNLNYFLDQVEDLGYWRLVYLALLRTHTSTTQYN